MFCLYSSTAPRSHGTGVNVGGMIVVLPMKEVKPLVAVLVEIGDRHEVNLSNQVLGYPISVVEMVGDEFISVRKNLIS